MLVCLLSALLLYSTPLRAAEPSASVVAHRADGHTLGIQTEQPAAKRQRTGKSSPLILISIDGFRWDYLDRHEAKHLARLADEGVRSEGLIPVFPSKTFPNHYSIVTGLYPENHGIVANRVLDPARNVVFSPGNREEVMNPTWWGGEPIWVTAQRQGLMTATYFWVGSEAEIRGQRPTYWYPYDHAGPGTTRVDQVLRWLDLPERERPAFIRGLRDEVNMIVVSDHGMAAAPRNLTIYLEDFLEDGDARIVELNPVLMLYPAALKTAQLIPRLKGAHPALTVYSKDELPERFHIRNSDRTAPVVALADEGWTIRRRRGPTGGALVRGEHGYDNHLTSMHGLLLMHGPAFLSSLVLPPVENIHLYELMAHLLDVDPAENDGRFEVLSTALVGH
jgi:predicted AlkP superfamily pyrophosphatase or phosphodiesterase